MSDAPAPATETQFLPDCLLEIPFLVSAVAIPYHLPNITFAGGMFTVCKGGVAKIYTTTAALAADLAANGGLRLTGSDLCSIYTNPTTEFWEDFLSRPYNLGGQPTGCIAPVNTHNYPLIPVARLDSSGTSQVFTTYLANCGNCPGITPNNPLPAGTPPLFTDSQFTSLVVRVSGGIALVNYVAANPGTLGYAGLGDIAVSNNPNIPVALILEAGGSSTVNADFLAPTAANVQAAVSSGNCTSLTCVPGAYPIVTVELFEVFGTQPTDFIACNVKQFILFLLTQGQKFASQVPGYFPMSQDCIAASKALLDDIGSAICQPCIEPCIPCATVATCPEACPTCNN